MKASPNRFVSANLPVNKFKNRLVNILPCKYIALFWFNNLKGCSVILPDVDSAMLEPYMDRPGFLLVAEQVVCPSTNGSAPNEWNDLERLWNQKQEKERSV